MTQDEERRFGQRWTIIVGVAALVAIIPAGIQALYSKLSYDLSAKPPGANVKLNASSSVELGPKSLEALRVARSDQRAATIPSALKVDVGQTTGARTYVVRERSVSLPNGYVSRPKTVSEVAKPTEKPDAPIIHVAPRAERNSTFTQAAVD